MTEVNIEALQKKIADYLDGFYISHLIDVGTELGLFEELFKAKDRISISNLASNLSLHEPYVRIWCQTAYYQEILDIDKQGLVKLMPFMDLLLADKSSDKYMAGRVRMTVQVHGDRIMESPQYYRSGDYTTEYSSDRSDIVAAALEAPHRSMVFLLTILPEEDRLKEKLSKDFRILDIGCGQGSFLMKMAEAFPNGRFVGIDPIKHGIEVAKNRTAELGLDSKIQLETSSGENIKYADEFDIACMVMTFHEIPQDVRKRVVEKAYQSLKNDGLLLIIDFSFPENLVDFRNQEFGPGIMDQFFETALGIVHLNANEQESLLGEAGFDGIQRISMNGADFITANK